MSWTVDGLDLTAAQVAAAMSMTIAKTEPYYQILGFADTIRDLGIAPSMSLNDVMRKTSMHNFGATDCALPMIHAQRNKTEIDTFVVITDNETWFGNVHPHVALQNYRQAMGIDAKLVVVACTPTEFSIANPEDRGMLDIVGGDSNLPKLITEFSAGRI
jgi:60 kDa SS-A/Ro ribonucleoprotein